MSPPPPTMPPPCKGALTMTSSYSEDKKMAIGTCMESDPIDVGGHSWCIAFYPNGRFAGEAGFMSLFLLLADDAAAEDDKDVDVKLRFMMHEAGSETMTFTSGEDAAVTLSQRRHYTAAGFTCFVSHEDFEKSSLFESDHFEIRCELTVFPAGSQPTAEASSSDQPSVVKAPPPVAAPPKPSAARAAPPSSPTTPPCAAASPSPSVEIESVAPPPPPPPPCKGAVTMTGSYSEDKKMAIGTYMESDPIDVGGHSWRIAFYPNGRFAGEAGFMSLFLLLADDAAAEDDKDVDVKLRFMMLEAGSETMTFTSGEDAAVTLSQRRHYTAAGFTCFVSHEDFEKSSLFESDHFEIRCELTVFPASSQPTAEASSSDQPSVAKAPPPVAAPPKPSAARAAPPSSPTTLCAASPAPSVERATPPTLSGLHADLGRLLGTKEGADVEIEVCGKVFAAHKSVLAAWSSVFMAYFFGPAKEEDTSYVRIGGDDDDAMRPEAFEAVLHYMYTDSLPEMTMDSPEQGAAAAVLAAAEDLLIAADRYNLKDLKSLTESKLCSHVSVSTVLLLLTLAERCHCCVLKEMCLGFIGSSCIANARAIVASNNNVENLARCSPSVVKDVITEILDAREARFRRRLRFCIYALCFFMPFVVFSFLHVTFL